MQKGDKCLAFIVYQDKPVWVCGNLHDVMDLPTQRQFVIAVRKDYQAQVGGNAIIVTSPFFCFDSILAAGESVDAIGKALDKFIQNHVPDNEQPPLVIDVDSNAFGSPLITTASPELLSGADQG